VSIFSIGAEKWPGISKLVEEAGEVLQICGKLLGTNGESKHWNVPNLNVALEDELADLMAAILFVIVECGLDASRITLRCAEKVARFSRWQEEHEECEKRRLAGDPTP
jgi:NTP pyrophosphatase (non-canonical NTP hydrolase)